MIQLFAVYQNIQDHFEHLEFLNKYDQPATVCQHLVTVRQQKIHIPALSTVNMIIVSYSSPLLI